ncbi:MAG: hypothetical protein ACXW18_01620 [Pyrinomonadaceae bacterium]
MTDKPQAQPNSSRQFSDDAIRSFLLGELGTSEQTVFEESLLTDGELEARVRLAEFELSDDYASARLSMNERELFRERFLLTSDRNQIVDVSRALHHRFAPQSRADSRAALSQRLRAFFDFKQPAWKYAFAALILIVFFATVLLVTKQPQIVRWLTQEHVKPKPRVTPTPQMMNHPGSQSSPLHAEQSPALPAHEAPALTVVLSPDTSFDQSPTVNLPNDEAASIRFQLTIQTDRKSSYRADVFTSSGESVFRAESLKPSDTNPNAIFLDVLRRMLKSGQYLVILSRVDGGSTVKAADYYFKVQ